MADGKCATEAPSISHLPSHLPSSTFAIVSALLVSALTLRAHDPITTRVTWVGDISRIVQSRCVRCHNPDGVAPMSLTTYEEARRWARAIKEETMTRRMPKWHAARGYGDFRNDPSLSPLEIALIAAWADGGAPRGTAADERPISTNAPPASRPEIDLRSVRTVTVPCGERALPDGTLLAVQPDTAADASVGMSIRLPDGQRRMVGWIKTFDPDLAATYWLRTPLDLPTGSTLVTEPLDGCTVTVFVTARR